MDMTVNFGEGMQVNAHFNGFTINTDQSKKAGGQGTAPDPFSYFLSSLATCSGFFVLRFCQARNLPTEGIQLRLSTQKNNETHRIENILINIELPPNFPEKYAPALIRAVNECSVKKALLNPPIIEVTTQRVS